MSHNVSPKEKAKELFYKFHSLIFFSKTWKQEAKAAALICVDEIITNIDATILYHKKSMALHLNKQYWQEVKEEINKFNIGTSD